MAMNSAIGRGRSATDVGDGWTVTEATDLYTNDPLDEALA